MTIGDGVGNLKWREGIFFLSFFHPTLHFHIFTWHYWATMGTGREGMNQGGAAVTDRERKENTPFKDRKKKHYKICEGKVQDCIPALVE